MEKIQETAQVAMTIIVDASVIIYTLNNPSRKEASFIFNDDEKVDFVAPVLVFEEVLSKKEYNPCTFASFRIHYCRIHIAT